MTQNSFPMREWHVKHMEKTIVKFVTGLSENASMWEKRQNKRYGRITNICRQIDYDIKQGVTTEQVLMILQKIRDDSSFSTLREKDGSIERLDEVEKYFVTTSNRRNYRY
ncbi:MAG: hypothetical protein WCF06_09775 [Nitrososphaeraceae archaeon]